MPRARQEDPKFHQRHRMPLETQSGPRYTGAAVANDPAAAADPIQETWLTRLRRRVSNLLSSERQEVERSGKETARTKAVRDKATKGDRPAVDPQLWKQTFGGNR